MTSDSETARAGLAGDALAYTIRDSGRKTPCDPTMPSPASKLRLSIGLMSRRDYFERRPLQFDGQIGEVMVELK